MKARCSGAFAPVLAPQVWTGKDEKRMIDEMVAILDRIYSWMLTDTRAAIASLKNELLSLKALIGIGEDRYLEALIEMEGRCTASVRLIVAAIDGPVLEGCDLVEAIKEVFGLESEQ